MKHYEVVFMAHPDQADQLEGMLEKYRTIIESKGGKIYRLEDWGRRQLAYPIAKLHKAQYVLMNIECGVEELNELKTAFRYNDAILRNLVTNMPKAVTETSLMAVAKDNKKEI